MGDTLDIGAKMNIKPGFAVAILNQPDDLVLDVGGVRRVGADEAPDAAVLFVKDRDELDRFAFPVVAFGRQDLVAWIAYPKGGQLGTDVNRDSFWDWASSNGLRPVRQVAIDEVWSALRFRPA